MSLAYIKESGYKTTMAELDRVQIISTSGTTIFRESWFNLQPDVLKSARKAFIPSPPPGYKRERLDIDLSKDRITAHWKTVDIMVNFDTIDKIPG